MCRGSTASYYVELVARPIPHSYITLYTALPTWLNMAQHVSHGALWGGTLGCLGGPPPTNDAKVIDAPRLIACSAFSLFGLRAS